MNIHKQGQPHEAGLVCGYSLESLFHDFLSIDDIDALRQIAKIGLSTMHFYCSHHHATDVVNVNGRVGIVFEESHDAIGLILEGADVESPTP